MDEVDIVELKKNIFFQAERYILDNIEFGPYGAFLEDDTVRMVSQRSDEDGSHVDADTAVSELKKVFLRKFELGKISAAAIGYDVALTTTDSDGSYIKRDALCMSVSTDGDNWTRDYFPYLVLGGQCVWK